MSSYNMNKQCNCLYLLELDDMESSQGPEIDMDGKLWPNLNVQL